MFVMLPLGRLAAIGEGVGDGWRGVEQWWRHGLAETLARSWTAWNIAAEDVSVSDPAQATDQDGYCVVHLLSGVGAEVEMAAAQVPCLSKGLPRCSSVQRGSADPDRYLSLHMIGIVMYGLNL